jgi:hypothetical protein
MRSGGGSFAHISVHLDEDWRTHLSTYPDHPPILDIDAGSTLVGFSIAGRVVTQAAVEFARELAAQAARYAAEMERLHAWQTETGGNGSGSPAGNGEAA